MTLALPLTALAVMAITGSPGPLASDAQTSGYTASDFSHLRFLEGVWQGAAPDGSRFRDRYTFTDATTLKSERLSNDVASEPTDSSTVTFANARIISRWGEFEWTASEVRDGFVNFEPLGQTPGSFSWTRVDADHVDVTQRWTDAEGVDQRYVISLERVK